MIARTAMNILVVTPWDQQFGGVASVVGNLATCLRARGHRVLFLHPGASSTIRHTTTAWGFDAVEINLRQPYIRERPIRSLAAFLLTLPTTMLRLVRLLREQGIEIVNIHYPLDSFVYFALCRWLVPIQLVVSVHGTDVLSPSAPPRRHSRALRVLLGGARRIVAPSRAFLEQFLGAFPRLRGRGTFIHNGLNLAEVQGVANDAVHGDAPFVLCIASHDAWKGLDVLIRAVALLEEWRTPVRMVLVGDGPLRAQLERLAADLCVAHCVQFLGTQRRSEVVRLLHACSAFVLPSRSEPFGVVVIEALACEKPVVASAVGGIPEIIEHGRTGLLVAPDDAAALARALGGTLADPERGRALAWAGRADVEQRFPREVMSEAYERLYAELLTER